MKKLIVSLSMVALLAGCGGGGVRYEDPNKTETVNIGWGRTDVQMTVKKMVDDLIRKNGTFKTRRPYVAISNVVNKTEEYIDTKMITDQIRTALLESGCFRFTTEKKDLKENLEDVEMQEESGLYKQNERTAKKGNWNPPEYVMRGSVSAIYKRNDDVRDTYYQITLRMDNINEATIEWQQTKEIAKQQDR